MQLHNYGGPWLCTTDCTNRSKYTHTSYSAPENLGGVRYNSHSSDH